MEGCFLKLLYYAVLDAVLTRRILCEDLCIYIVDSIQKQIFLLRRLKIFLYLTYTKFKYKML